MDGHGHDDSGILDAVAVGALVGGLLGAPLVIAGVLFRIVAWLLVGSFLVLRALGRLARRGRTAA